MPINLSPKTSGFLYFFFCWNHWTVPGKKPCSDPHSLLFHFCVVYILVWQHALSLSFLSEKRIQESKMAITAFPVGLHSLPVDTPAASGVAGSSNAAWDYFLQEVRSPLIEKVDPFLPFVILLTCNIVIIVKMVRASQERARKLSQDSQQNVYGVLPTMLGGFGILFFSLELWFLWMCVNLCECVWTCVNMCKLCEYVWTGGNMNCKSMWTGVNLCELVWIYVNWCEYVWTCVNLYELVGIWTVILVSGISFAFIILRAPLGIMYIWQFSFPVYYDSSSEEAAINRYKLQAVHRSPWCDVIRDGDYVVTWWGRQAF